MNVAEDPLQVTVRAATEAYQHGQAALATAHSNAPANTRKNYQPKQKEWCIQTWEWPHLHRRC